jgi:hypothetical protein
MYGSEDFKRLLYKYYFTWVGREDKAGIIIAPVSVEKKVGP